jgi:hypothetical protein
MSRPSVLGWKAPGDGTEPYPAMYWPWFRLYRWTRRAKHRIVLMSDAGRTEGG